MCNLLMSNKLIKDFYKIVNCMINKIKNNKEICDKLFGCKYDIYEQKSKELNYDNKTKPLIFCLGGMAYQIYYDIISKYYQNVKLESKTEDYDFSFSLGCYLVASNLIFLDNVL